MTMPLEQVPLDWVVTVTDVPSKGLVWRAQATPDECARLAAALDLQNLSAVIAEGRIEAIAGGCYRMKARLKANVEQACVVTLDPISSTLDEPIRVEFRPAEDFAESADLTPALEAEYDIEPIVHSELETGRIVFEHLAAAIDPYPRAPGIAFDAIEVKPRGAGPAVVHPFAALAKLKTKPE